MTRLWAKLLLALIVMLAGVGSVSRAGVEVDDSFERNARLLASDLEFFMQKFRTFAPGATEPLFYGRSLPVAPETCSPAAEPRRFALLIAASDPGSFQLPEVLNDVDLLASALTKVGAAPDDVHKITGDRATREGVVEAAWTVLSQLACGDKVFIYFGGAAEMMDRLLFRLAGPEEKSPGGATLDTVVDASHALLDYARARQVPDLMVPVRDGLDRVEWFRGSGLAMFLNGEGKTVGSTGENFEILTSADLSELITLLRNHRADVTAVIDTSFADNAAILEHQRSVSAEFWSAEVHRASEDGAALALESRIRPATLVPAAGELAVFYSSVGRGASVSTSFGVEGEKVRYGVFTFRLAEAMVNGRNATVEDVRNSLDRIVQAGPPHARAQVHRIEATRPDMPLFGVGEARAQRSDTIRIIEPSGLRGPTTVETAELTVVGVVDWRSPAKAVLVEGQPAALTRDGRFSAAVKLNAGVNTISVTALTSDDEIHVMAPLQVTFDGDLGKLKGEGTRYAVIIANQNYLPTTQFSSLATPAADAEALRATLVEDYGFTTSLPIGPEETMSLFLLDAGKDEIEEALYMVSQVATEQDSVLIYYAGHGVYDERTTNAYWVPVDATRPFNYLSGVTITEHIQRMLARSVILISDSCYAGALRSGGDLEPPPAVTEKDRERALLRMAGLRSRVLITSGGTEPVMDTGGGGHSIFARALLTGLADMKGTAFAAEDLFRDYIRPMVSGRAEQMPQMRPIDHTGHEPAADVVFVRTQPPAIQDS